MSPTYVSAYSQDAGVKTTEELTGFPGMLNTLRQTFAFRKGRVGDQSLDFKQYANVLRLTKDLSLAISTDGVGTKVLIARDMGRYDTIGIDCVAMNVNDIICVGAEPISMTDYIAIGDANDRILADLALGLFEGAKQADINIPGGELSQIPELVSSGGLDLVGTCVGVVHPDRVITGSAVRPGDAIIGFESSGIHSNGLTLARKVLIGDGEGQFGLHDEVPELGCTLGWELLKPTKIYAGLVASLLGKVDIRGLAHITSDGFLNLQRMSAPVGFRIENLPPLSPIFRLIMNRLEHQQIPDMYLMYNMGIGFCAIVPQADVEAALEIGRRHWIASSVLGTCFADEEQHVEILGEPSLRSVDKHFVYHTY